MRGATRVRRVAARTARAAARRTGGRWRVPGLLTVVLTAGDREDRLSESLDAALRQDHGRIEVLLATVGDGPTPPLDRRDQRVRILGRYADLRAVRLAGLSAAAGTFVTFLDADHLPTRHGWSAATASSAATGSGTVLLGHRTYRRGRTFDVDEWVRLVHGRPRYGVTPEAYPALLADSDAAAAVFRTDLLRRVVAAAPDAPAHDATLLAVAIAESPVDLLSTVGVLLRALPDRTGPAHLPLDLGGLRAHTASLVRAHALLRPLGDSAAGWHTGAALGRLLPPYLDLLWYDEEVREALPGLLTQLLPLAGEAYAAAVPAQQKGLHQLLLEDTGRARTFLGAVRPSARRHPTTVAEGGVLLDLGQEWADVPAGARLLADVETQVRAEVTALDVEGEHVLLEGWAFLDAVDPLTSPATTLRWVTDQGRSLALSVEATREPGGDRVSDLPWADVTPTGFRARCRLADLDVGSWALEATVGERGLTGTARAVVRPWTMAGMPARRDAGGRRLVVDHDDLQQLRLTVSADPVLVTADRAGTATTLTLARADVTRLAARPIGGGDPVALPLGRAPEGGRGVLDDHLLDAGRAPYVLEAFVRGGRVLTDGLLAAADTVSAWSGRRGGVLLAPPAASAEVLAARLEPEELVVVLRLGAGVPGWRASLVQGVTETVATLRALDVERHEARFPLVSSDDGRAGLPLPSGEHVLCVANDVRTSWLRARPAPDVLLPAEELQPRMRLRVEAFAPDLPGVRLVVAPPLEDDELGERHQRLLRQAAAVEVAGHDSVFFRAMFGEHTSGNGLGVHEELRRRGTRLELLWAVADRSVPVPVGGIGVVERSRAWHEAIARSRYHMVDVHQVEWFRRPTGQVLIQTMHGYPYKLMGHPWWRTMGNSVQEVASLDRRTREWTVLVSPATYATPLLRAAFLEPAGADDVRVLETGYPRNDALVGPEAADIRARTRALLGISPEQIVVLYAPTFRDYLSPEDRTARAVTFFDVDESLATLPEEYVVLRRGHAFNARVRDDRLRTSARFRDVTDHPDVNELILASDVGVLDYSSLRFDYVLTSNPMVFLVPDLAEYDRHRGGVIPYGPTAPGPRTTNTAQTVEWLRDLDRLRDDYAAARTAFRAEYVDLEDGHSAARLVDAVFAPEDR